MLHGDIADLHGRAGAAPARVEWSRPTVPSLLPLGYRRDLVVGLGFAFAFVFAFGIAFAFGFAFVFADPVPRTTGPGFPPLGFVSCACAAARRAIGTRNGEHDT